MKKTRLKKIKCKRIFAFSAVLIVLFAFLVIPVSADSSLIYSGLSYNDVAYDPETSYFSSSPVSVDVFVPSSYTYIEGDGEANITYYGLSASLNPICHLNDFNFLNYTRVNDSLPSSYSWSGFVAPVSSSLHLFESSSDLEGDFKFIGTCEYYFSGFKFSNSQAGSGSEYPQYRVPRVKDVKFSLRDFYLWNYFFDESIDTSSEVSLVFDYESMNSIVRYIDFYYSLAGDSTINKVTIEAFDRENNIDLYNGEFVLSPSFLGIEDPDSLVYVHQCDFYFSVNGYDASLLLSDLVFDFDVIYTFNPYLDNYSVSVPDDPDDPDDPDIPVSPVDPDNPAIALSRYTEWIGDALGGFLDFNIFPGFTLGGIFMTLLAFSCVVWFLKLVAGG